MHFISKNITFLNNKAIYDGKIILFLHGWAGDKFSFYSCYNFLASYNYAVISLDLSGFGENSKLSKDYTIFDYANDVKLFLENLNIDNFYVVSHSFGSRIASILAQHFNIEKMVITGGAGLKYFSLTKILKVYYYKFFKFLVKTKIIPKSKLDKFGSEDYKNLPMEMKKTFINIVNQNLIDYYAKINSKTLLFWGKQDNQTPLFLAKKLKKIIKNSKLMVVNGGHFAYVDEDFTFCNIVLEFFKGDL